jgi:hypothetical protein
LKNVERNLIDGSDEYLQLLALASYIMRVYEINENEKKNKTKEINN